MKMLGFLPSIESIEIANETSLFDFAKILF